MIRHYCDCCNRPLPPVNFGRSGVVHTAWVRYGTAPHEGKNVSVNISATLKGAAWNGMDLCKYCIIDVVKTLDDRPENV